MNAAVSASVGLSGTLEVENPVISGFSSDVVALIESVRKFVNLFALSARLLFVVAPGSLSVILWDF